VGGGPREEEEVIFFFLNGERKWECLKSANGGVLSSIRGNGLVRNGAQSLQIRQEEYTSKVRDHSRIWDRRSIEKKKNYEKN